MTEVLSAPSGFDGHYRPSSRRHHKSSPPSSPSSIPRSYQQSARRIENHTTYLPHASALKSQGNTIVNRVPVPQPERTQFLFCDFEDDIVEDLNFPVYDYAETITPNASPELHPPSTFDSSESCTTTSSSTVSPPNSPDLDQPVLVALDDNTIRHEPSRHVDYLSHDWKEEDIWASWRYMVTKRNVYQNSARLENASWRTWAKAKYNLKTLSPEKLNWLKDCDVTWLYGPLSTGEDKVSQYTSPKSPSTEQPIQSLNALTHPKKPILKKRSMSEVMLQRSLSTSSLLKQATAAIHSQQSERKNSRPPLSTRAHSDFTTYPFHYVMESVVSTNELPSALSTGTHSPSYQRHIHFNNRVEQCIAVDKADDEDHEYGMHELEDDSDSSDDGLVMMAPSRGSARTTPRGSFSEHQTIAMLPSTTLKPVEDVEPVDSKKAGSLNSGLVSFLSSSIGASVYTGYAGSSTTPAATDTIPDPIIHSNFLVGDEDDDEDDYAWQPSGAFANRRDSIAIARPKFGIGEANTTGGDSKSSAVDSDSDEGEVASGLFGRAVDAVNTARDIAHVLWNVGWRK